MTKLIVASKSITGHTPDCTSPRHANSTSKRSYICKQVEEMHYSSQTGESWCHSACFRGRRPRTKSRPAGVTTRLGLQVQRVARAAAHPKPAGYSCPSTPAAPLHLGTAAHQDYCRAATPQAAQGTPRHADRRISRAAPRAELLLEARRRPTGRGVALPHGHAHKIKIAMKSNPFARVSANHSVSVRITCCSQAKIWQGRQFVCRVMARHSRAQWRAPVHPGGAVQAPPREHRVHTSKKKSQLPGVLLPARLTPLLPPTARCVCCGGQGGCAVMWHGRVVKECSLTPHSPRARTRR